MFVLKEVNQENKQKVNKLMQVNRKEFFEKGEEISMRTLQEIYEDRLMCVKRATKVPEQVVQEAEEDWNKAMKDHENKARGQKEQAVATATASSQPQTHQKQAGRAISNQGDPTACQRTSRTSGSGVLTV